MELDDAYANAPYIEGAEGYPPRWAAEAAAFRERLGDRVEPGLTYGAGEREKFDLFHPEGTAKGTVIFIHGGYWKAFDRSDWSHLAAGPLARGWAVAMPSYTLCPNARISAITRQIAAAVEAVADRTAGPLAVTGHSAGGHLAARMLDAALLPRPVSDRIGMVVPISPLSDLRPLMRTQMNEAFGLDAAEAEAESPIFMPHRRPAIVTVWVGEAERPAFLDQARWLAQAWHCGLVIAPDRHHFDVIDALADPASTLTVTLTSG